MTIVTESFQKFDQGNAKVQYIAATASNLGCIVSGMHYGWPSPALPKLLTNSSSISVNNDQGAWIAVMPLLGAILGSLIVGVTVDIIGRKRMILVANIPHFVAWLMVAYAKTVAVIFIGRFIAGVSDGLVFTAVPMYIGEISNPNIRGLLGSGVAVAWILGTYLENIVGLYLSISTAALVCSLLPVISVLTFVFMPESPYYLIMKGKLAEARKNLKSLKGMDNVDDELSRLSSAVKSQTENTGKFLDLFTSRSNRKAVLAMVVLRAAQQLSGTSVVTFYAHTIFIESGSNISPELGTILYFSVQFFMTVFCSSIVDKAGRRPLLIVSSIGASVALFTEGTFFYIKSCTDIDTGDFDYLPVITLIGYVVIFSLGMQTIPLLMLGELFPTNVKAFAICLADIYFAAIATMATKFFQVMKDSFGMYVAFYAFAVCCVIGLVFIVLFVPETKGRTLEDIQAELKGEKPIRH